MEERIKTNYDHPMAFDNELLEQHLLQLLHGESIQKPIYDFVNHTRSKEIENIEPSEVVVIEGLFVLENDSIRRLCDIKIFVDTDADLRFIRRLLRDVKKTWAYTRFSSRTIYKNRTRYAQSVCGTK